MRLARPAPIASAALLACLFLAGCASSATAGWTFAPPPSATPVPSVAASGSAAAPSGPVAASGSAAAPSGPAAGSAAPSGPAASGSSAAGSAAPSGAAADVTISALNIAFEQTSVTAPAGKAFTLLFDNKDASVSHDVYIKNSGGTDVFEGAIVTGPAQTTYNVPSLPAGSYTFVCSVHSNMTGTMVVQ